METASSENIIVGRNPILEALKAGAPLEKIFVLYGVQGGSLGKILHLAKQQGVPCVDVDRQKFRELVGDAAAQGVAALVGSKSYVDLDEILMIAAKRKEPSFVLVLDGIEDPQNLGALIRTAECAGVHGVVIPKHHAASVSSAVGKASAGASEHMPVAKVTNVVACLEELKKKGVWVVGSAADGDRFFTEVDYTMPVALVVGGEGKGMRKLVKERCDFLVKIPLYGKIESLNASVAGALLMYEVVRKRVRGSATA
jgi:23S rRNA (guanosine2251-2'-O)-methyltransferase